MPETKQYRTHYLFLLIVATVSRASAGMTVEQIGEVLGYPPDIIAHCIGLHLYLECENRQPVPLPPPNDYVVPRPSDVITRGMLDLERKRKGPTSAIDGSE
jgi:hypothetical protein